LLKILTQHQKK